MKTKKIWVNGRQQAALPVGESTEHLELEAVYDLDASIRGHTSLSAIELKENQLIGFEFDDGGTWLGGVDALHLLFPESELSQREQADGFILPSKIEQPVTERGLIGQVGLKLLKVFTKKTISNTVRQMARRLEEKQLDNQQGLYQVQDGFQLEKWVAETPASDPMLLFIHGTASSSKGSFAELADTPVWHFLREQYGTAILAFQHETLTKSPLQNVLDLVSQLPAHARLHLISHSRGGLVGDVLSRFCIQDSRLAGFTDEEKAALKKEGRSQDLEVIGAIETAMASRNISVEKFIRVACPAGGTTLASSRMEYFFNILFNLAGATIGGPLNPVYQAFKDLIAAVIDCKDDISVLPGLEAMNPASPFIKVLNYPITEAAIHQPLIVISGNCGLSFSWKSLLIIASKLFYTASNDLVVNTASMYRGARRLSLSQYFYDKNSGVDHFHYFQNDTTRQAILLALQHDGLKLIPGFSPIDTQLSSTDRNALLKLEGGQVFRNKVTGHRPIAVILPGIMGSNIAKDGKLIWINYLRFLTGELPSLKLTATGIDAPSLVKTSYEKLADFLSRDYDVVTFPFDWRKQLNECAKLFNQKILELLKYGQPIKLIGHSMGGVLVRDFIINHTETWEQLNHSPGFQLVFLGSPLGGSYRIPYVLFGKDVIIDKLAKIDLFHTKKELLGIFSNLPGLLSLLPLRDDEPDQDFARLSTWKKMQAASGDTNWPIPAQKDLDVFKQYRDQVNRLASDIDFTHAVYIAGRDQSTPCSYFINDQQQLVFESTAAGDQSVTWDSGIPPKMLTNNSVYFVDATHGALSCAPELFNGISEILAQGSTSLFRKTRPALRSNMLRFRTPDTVDFDLSASGVENSILGIGAARPQEVSEIPIKVCVSNGDLKYAAYPVLAGHFMNDGILYAEKAIDYNMKGALTERYLLGLYPGEVGSSEVMLQRHADGSTSGFHGTVIIGLGAPGTLTAYQLAKSVEQGVSKYLLLLNNKATSHLHLNNAEQVGITSLAIGCDYGGLSVETSLRAIITGVQNANRKIKQALSESIRTISVIEFVEQYQDRALSCFYALSAISQSEDQALNISIDAYTIQNLPGRKVRLPIDNTEDWWTRIHVRYKDYMVKDARIAGMQFNIATGGAREEQRDLFTSRKIITALVDKLSVDNQWTPQLARTIFELLVPNDFKDQLKKQANITWIVDKDSAAYPWELLQDSTNNAKPLCINSGMIRQLATRDYRLRINPVNQNTALVIADPQLEGYIPQLAGALEEGKLAADILQQQGFQTTTLLQSNAAEIIQALFSEDYKIIHLAGHGIYNPDPEAGSGMVIGNNIFLSSREVSQMSTVPELVFINCCHLGKTDATGEALYRERYKLAANLGTQLIENGVKAVIAAGWAVDDAAALEFTRVFYQYMFEGYTFGESVLEARKIVFARYPRNNTWGAYQCYGDQFYTVAKRRNRIHKKSYVIVDEAEIDLVNLLNKIEISGYTVEDHLSALQQITTAMEASKIGNGKTSEMEGRIYAGLGMYAEAIERYSSLLQKESASFSFSAVEQYCNLRAKHYVEQYLNNPESNKPELRKEMDQVLQDMTVLIGYSQTSERLSIIASTWKRKSIMAVQRKQKISALKTACSYYRQAQLNPNTLYRSYALINWLTLEGILVAAGTHRWGQKTEDAEPYTLPTEKTVLKELAALKDLQANQEELSYWHMSGLMQAVLCEWMITGQTKDKAYFDLLLQGYNVLWQKAASPGNKKTELEQLDFLLYNLPLLPEEKQIPMVQHIGRLKAMLEKWQVPAAGL